MSEPIIQSILDTDLYKISMSAAVLRSYDNWDVTYKLFTRGDTVIPDSLCDALRQEVDSMANLQLTDAELNFLQEKCPYLKRSFLAFLKGFRFDPSEVKIGSEDGKLQVTVEGPWFSTIFWEVPLMALISELYYNPRGSNFCFPRDKAKAKGYRLAQHGCMFADFGTRRRFSRDVHDDVVEHLLLGVKAWQREREASAGVYDGPPTYELINNMTGTSNVWLAMKHGLKPMGTQAHEWIMAIASQFGYVRANANALKSWQMEFMGDLGIALTDTYSSDNFFDQFTMDFAKVFDGLRHDSGDPIKFAEKAIACYKRLGINPLHKTIVFSDGLNVDAAVTIKKWCERRIGCAFGIGTHFSNDCGHKPLNMVIKMTSCNGQPTVKLSDVAGKETGDPETIKAVKQILRFNGR